MVITVFVAYFLLHVRSVANTASNVSEKRPIHQKVQPCTAGHVFERDLNETTCADGDDFGRKYVLQGRIGEGKHAVAFSVRERSNQTLPLLVRVLKHPIDQEQLSREATVGKLTYGIPNLMTLHDVVCFHGRRTPIWEVCRGDKIFSNTNYRLLFDAKGCPKVSTDKLQSILAKLVGAVYALRNLGILHNDIHPNNVLYDFQSNSLCLIDYQQADFVNTNLLHGADKTGMEQLMWRRITLGSARGGQREMDPVWRSTFRGGAGLRNDDLFGVARLVCGLTGHARKPVLGYYFRDLVKVLGTAALQRHERRFNLSSDHGGFVKATKLNCVRRCNVDPMFAEYAHGLLQYSYMDRSDYFDSLATKLSQPPE